MPRKRTPARGVRSRILTITGTPLDDANVRRAFRRLIQRLGWTRCPGHRESSGTARRPCRFELASFSSRNVELFGDRLAETLPDGVSTREVQRMDGTERK